MVAAFRAAEPRQLLVWLEAHRALGVAHFLLAPDAPDADVEAQHLHGRLQAVT